ncbi:MAG: MarR family winged helix-turn-helix transcriptional regulator [Gammaproteobacteria bacterium]
MPKRKTETSPDAAGILFTFFNEIGIISQLSGKLFESQLPDGLTSSQFGVLNWFHRVDDEATPKRLAVAFQVTGGAMTNTLKRLQSKGLIKVVPDPNSGRQKKVTITAKGRMMRDKAIAAAAPLFEEFAREFPVGQLEAQLSTLREIRQYLDEYRYRESV